MGKRDASLVSFFGISTAGYRKYLKDLQVSEELYEAYGLSFPTSATFEKNNFIIVGYKGKSIGYIFEEEVNLAYEANRADLILRPETEDEINGNFVALFDALAKEKRVRVIAFH